MRKKIVKKTSVHEDESLDLGMRQKVVQNFSIYKDQLIDLRKISRKHNGQFMSTFVRYWIDYGIKKESTKTEDIDYN